MRIFRKIYCKYLLWICDYHFVFSIVDRSFTENLLFFKGKGPSIFHMLTIKSTIHHKVLQNPMTTFWKQTQKAMAYAWLNPIPMFVCLLTNELYLDPSHRSKTVSIAKCVTPTSPLIIHLWHLLKWIFSSKIVKISQAGVSLCLVFHGQTFSRYSILLLQKTLNFQKS